MTIETKKGLWVGSSFTEKFGNKDIEPATTVPAFKKLERDMYDREIKGDLGAEECALEEVAAFLNKPPEGCDDGYWNLFYVAGYVVNVHWSSGGQEWYVLAWELGDSLWYAGDRVFSRNWRSDALESSGATSDPLTLSPDAVELDHEQRIAKLEEIIRHHNLGV